MSQTPKPSHEHKMMQAQWTLDVPSKRILKMSLGAIVLKRNLQTI
jgi:hypothetical protein